MEDKPTPHPYENTTEAPKVRKVSLTTPVFIKNGEEYEPSEKDQLNPGDNLNSEGQVWMEGSLANVNDKKRTSILSAQNLGWKRYLGVLYTLISTNMFSLSSNLLKVLGHTDPLNLGCFAFPMAAVLSAPFIWYTLRVEKKPVMTHLLPVSQNKKVVFFMWFRAMISVLVSYGLIASFRYITVADSRTIMAASVITVQFFGCLCLGEKCGVVPVVIAVMALLGIGVMTRPPILTGAEEFDNETLIGVGLALLCMVFATIIILSLRFLQHVHHGVNNTFLYAWAFLCTLPFAIGLGTLHIPENPWDLVGMLGVGCLWSLGNTFLVQALQVEEAGVVALIRTSEVIFTFFWQMVILGVYPDLISLLGAVLVLTGVIMVTVRKWVASLDKKSAMRKRLAFLLL